MATITLGQSRQIYIKPNHLSRVHSAGPLDQTSKLAAPRSPPTKFEHLMATKKKLSWSKALVFRPVKAFTAYSHLRHCFFCALGFVPLRRAPFEGQGCLFQHALRNIPRLLLAQTNQQLSQTFDWNVPAHGRQLAHRYATLDGRSPVPKLVTLFKTFPARPGALFACSFAWPLGCAARF